MPGSPWGWHYGAGGSPAYQVAYGEEIETEGPHGFPVNEMLLMDWTDDHLGDNKCVLPPRPPPADNSTRSGLSGNRNLGGG